VAEYARNTQAAQASTQCPPKAGTSTGLASRNLKEREWRARGHIELLRDVSQRKRERLGEEMAERSRARKASREVALTTLVQKATDRVIVGSGRLQGIARQASQGSTKTSAPMQHATKPPNDLIPDDRPQDAADGHKGKEGSHNRIRSRSPSCSGMFASSLSNSSRRRPGSLSGTQRPVVSSSKKMSEEISVALGLPVAAGKESGSWPSTTKPAADNECHDEGDTCSAKQVISPRNIDKGAATQAEVFSPRNAQKGAEAFPGQIIKPVDSHLKVKNQTGSDKRIFCCPNAYPDLRAELLKRGWIDNRDMKSRFFDLKFSKSGDVDYETLEPHQQVNHFWRSWELTTKVGLTMNIRNAHWHSHMKADDFYPRAFNLYDPHERADFVADFKLTKAQAILHGFLNHLDTNSSWTFNEDVLRTALSICRRTLWDWDDLIDSDNPGGPLVISDTDWALLRHVNLDDVCSPLDDTANQNLDEVVAKRKRPTAIKRDSKEQDNHGSKLAEELASPVGPDRVCVCVSHYSTARGQHLRKEATFVLQEMAAMHPQYGCNGDRDAWIIKPAGKSRGRGIQVCRELHEVFQLTQKDDCQWIAQKYIERPQLIHGYKFDIRQWVVVTDWNPLTVWLWKQPYVRFAGKKYDPTITDKNQYVHLVNNSIVKHMAGFYEQNEDLDTSGYMWFRQQYEDWLHTKYCKCEHHHTPFLTAPPYTCETYGVRWEDVKFTEADSDDEEGEEEAALAHMPSGGSGLNPLPSKETSLAAPVPRASCASDEESSQLKNSDPETSAQPEDIQAPCAAKEANEIAASSPAEKGYPQSATKKNMSEESASEKKSSATAGKTPPKPCQNLWEECVKPQIRDIVLASLFCAADTIDDRKNSHQLYGYDFMISDDDRPGKQGLPRVWLIEVNSSPAMDYSTRITTPLVKKCMEDLLKVVVDIPANSDADTGEFELLRHPLDDQCAVRPRNHEKLELVGTGIEIPSWMKSKRRRERKETAEATES
jgi:hypothetical protein